MAGIKGVKSGAMSKLKGLTEQDLFKMKKEDLIDLLVSTSKTVTANVRRLKASEYSEISPFLLQRDNNKYPLPREIKRKVAQKMGVEQLKQELRDLAYTARLETSTVSGVKRYVKKFKEKTGKDLTELSSEDWERIRQKIEEAGMQEYVVILGKKENPYPYIKNSVISLGIKKSSSTFKLKLVTSSLIPIVKL